jgi:predicted amidophosphoribosyltransferase
MPWHDALRRTRRTRPQADLPAPRRHANVRGAFTCSAPAPVADRVVVLVDDVSTTGATLNACAAPLLAAGVREVRALTAARAMTRRPR